jgi:hypothetical protein
MTLECERIVPDEQALVTFEAQHPVARSHAHEPRVGGDAHDGGIEVHAWLGIPAGVEGGCQRQAVVADRHRRDLVPGGKRQGF